MITTEIKGGRTHLVTDGAYLVHKASGRRCGRRTYLMAGETPEDYDEVAEEPAYSEEEYNAKVAELIHVRYSADRETSLINNMLDDEPTEEHRAEYREYQAYRAECKERAKELLSEKPAEDPTEVVDQSDDLASLAPELAPLGSEVAPLESESGEDVAPEANSDNQISE